MTFSPRFARLIVGLSLWLFSSIAWGESGFFKSLPENPKVDAAKESVFKIFAPNFYEYRLFEDPVSSIKEIADISGVDEHEKAVIISQLRGCLEIKLEPCIIEAGYVRGTAFVLEKENILATVFHNVDLHLVSIRKIFKKFSRPIDPKIEKEMYSKMNHPFALVNSKGDVVWGLAEDQKTLKLVMKWEMLERKKLDSDLKSEDDWAVFQLSQPIGKPLKLASGVPAIGQDVFSVGFPSATTGRERFGRENSDGESLYFTKGKILDPKEVDGRIYGAPSVGVGLGGGMMPGPGSLMGGAMGAGMFSQMRGCSNNNACVYTTTDGKYGLSGAPLLNSQGEVVGIAASGLPGEDEEVAADNTVFWGPPVQALKSALEELLKPQDGSGS